MQTKSDPSFFFPEEAITTNMKLALLMPIILTLLHHSTPYYNITTLQYGFLFENIGNIHIQSSAWTFISHINLTTYRQEIHYAHDLLAEARRQCNMLNHRVQIAELCGDIILELDSELSEIERNNEYIISSDTAPDSTRRTKRGLLNIVGHGLKFLFGTLDSSDAKQYSNQIKVLTSTVDDFQNDVNTHTTILRNTLSKLNETTIGINKQGAAINKIIEEVNMLNKNLSDDYSRARTQSLFEELTNYLMLVIRKIERDQTKIFDIIFSAKYGLLHESLFDPDTIYKEMITAQLSTQGQHFPFQLDKSNVFKIMQLSSFNAAQYNDIIIFEIITPLVHEDPFAIYNIVSIPQHLINQQFKIITTNLQTFIISMNHDRYAPFSNAQHTLLRHCKQNGKIRICNLHTPMYFANGKKNCAIDFFLRGIIDHSICTIEETLITDQIWIWMQDPNKHIYISPKPFMISLNCRNHHQTVELSEIGLLNTNCTITSDTIHIAPMHLHHSQTLSTNIRPFTQIRHENNSANTHQASRPMIQGSMEPIALINTDNALTTTNNKIDKVTFTITIIPMATVIIILCSFAFWLYIKGIKHRTHTIQQQTDVDQGDQIQMSPT